jgi:8-oxo-dGTP diphosphatase
MEAWGKTARKPSHNQSHNVMSIKLSYIMRERMKFAVPVVLGIFLLCVICMELFHSHLFLKYMTSCPYVWHGGSPTGSHRGSCWCGADSYCMCTPSLAIDCIIEYQSDSLVLVFRKDPPSDVFAIPGGFVSVGETAELAAIREVKEETNLTVMHLEQFKLYSDPVRDTRRHTASMVFRCVVNSVLDLHTGDDAKKVVVIAIKDVLNLNLGFDHKIILMDYIKKYHSHFISPS